MSQFLHLSAIVLVLFCLPLANTEARCIGRKGGGEYRFHNPRIMGRPTPETGGGASQNQGLSEFKPLSRERGVGWGVKKPEEPKQQSSNPYQELSEHYRREQEWHSGALENPIRVSRPNWPKNPREQREEAEAFQPNPAEQQAAERLGKPPPEGGEQEIEALAPSYLDDRSRLIFSLRFNPDRDRLPEYHGWDSLAEVLLDFSGYLDKPEDPGIPEGDYEAQLNSFRVARELGARSWEHETVKNLEADGREDLIPQFKQDMQEYRKAVKGIVEVWRKRGLL